MRGTILGRCPMQPEPRAPAARGESPPLGLSFAELFDRLGTADLCYSARAQALSGHEVVIEGFLSRPHGSQPGLSLVSEPGVCPDCALVPVPAIALPDACAPADAKGDAPVRVRGRLGYGFRIDSGVASMLRIEAATLLLVDGQA
jgi:hypothetical protein